MKNHGLIISLNFLLLLLLLSFCYYCHNKFCLSGRKIIFDKNFQWTKISKVQKIMFIKRYS